MNARVRNHNNRFLLELGRNNYTFTSCLNIN